MYYPLHFFQQKQTKIKEAASQRQDVTKTEEFPFSEQSRRHTRSKHQL